jgi:hypothetical protein
MGSHLALTPLAGLSASRCPLTGWVQAAPGSPTRAQGCQTVASGARSEISRPRASLSDDAPSARAPCIVRAGSRTCSCSARCRSNRSCPRGSPFRRPSSRLPTFRTLDLSPQRPPQQQRHDSSAAPSTLTRLLAGRARPVFSSETRAIVGDYRKIVLTPEPVQRMHRSRRPRRSQ